MGSCEVGGGGGGCFITWPWNHKLVLGLFAFVLFPWIKEFNISFFSYFPMLF